MFGKLAGAWLGEKIAGPNKGAKGAILGYGAAALAQAQRAGARGDHARRLGVQEMARQAPRRDASYPSDATPSSPSASRPGFRNRARPCR